MDYTGLPRQHSGKEPAHTGDVRDSGSVPGLEKIPGNPLGIPAWKNSIKESGGL